jgi:hypothetical protein
VREESHLEDMRSAIRGDFERLRERRGEQELMRLPKREKQPEAAGDVDHREPSARRSWFARLLSP